MNLNEGDFDWVADIPAALGEPWVILNDMGPDECENIQHFLFKHGYDWRNPHGENIPLYCNGEHPVKSFLSEPNATRKTFIVFSNYDNNVNYANRNMEQIRNLYYGKDNDNDRDVEFDDLNIHYWSDFIK